MIFVMDLNNTCQVLLVADVVRANAAPKLSYYNTRVFNTQLVMFTVNSGVWSNLRIEYMRLIIAKFRPQI